MIFFKGSGQIFIESACFFYDISRPTSETRWIFINVLIFIHQMLILFYLVPGSLTNLD